MDASIFKYVALQPMEESQRRSSYRRAHTVTDLTGILQVFVDVISVSVEELFPSCCGYGYGGQQVFITKNRREQEKVLSAASLTDFSSFCQVGCRSLWF